MPSSCRGAFRTCQATAEMYANDDACRRGGEVGERALSPAFRGSREHGASAAPAPHPVLPRSQAAAHATATRGNKAAGPRGGRDEAGQDVRKELAACGLSVFFGPAPGRARGRPAHAPLPACPRSGAVSCDARSPTVMARTCAPRRAELCRRSTMRGHGAHSVSGS